MTSLVFFGSFQHFSSITLEKLIQSGKFSINAVITTPPRPGDRGIITKTNTQIYCEKHGIPVFPLENLNAIPPEIIQPDFIVVCGYGKFIPKIWLEFPKILPLNIHQSLLPQYAGRFPAQWAILQGAKTTGVTIIKMTESFTDKGGIVAQKSIDISPTDTSNTLYTKLYLLSAELAIDIIPSIKTKDFNLQPQTGTGFYARQITKDDGFFEPKLFSDSNNYSLLDRMLRSLSPWPGVWTHVIDKHGQKLTMKVISAKINGNNIELQNVLIEGKKPTNWSEISSHYSLTN
jgi:methionyl-tRNA formyltransferase